VVTTRNLRRIGAVLSWALLLSLLSLSTRVLADGKSTFERGRQAFQRGAFAEAALAWEQAAAEFKREGNPKQEILASISMGGAYEALGQQRRAVKNLEQTLELAEKKETSLVPLAKAKLGAALAMTLQTEQATNLLQEALEAASSSSDAPLAAGILNDLGNLQSAQKQYPEALKSFEDALSQARKAGSHPLAAQALANAAVTAARSGDTSKADSLNTEALKEIEMLEASHLKAILLLTAAQTDHQIQSKDKSAKERSMLRAQKSLESARVLAEQIGDRSTETYALGYLGQLYLEDGQTEPALALTRRAAFMAQQAQMPEALYRWEWQRGKLLKLRGDDDAAIAAYRRAIENLQPIRNDVSLGYGNALGQGSFRETVGPMFFELADLLLSQAKSTKDPNREKQLLIEARDTVEQLKAVELEDYFRDDCVNVQRAKAKPLDNVDEHTAIVYYIPLPDRTEALLGLSTGLQRYTLDVTSENLNATAKLFRRHLETRTTFQYRLEAQQLYDWLIRPMRGVLDERHIDTLVFLPDGALRTVPFATLHDGDKFLVENFAIAIAPGLSMVEARPLQREKAKLLLNGLTKSVQNFPALDFVKGELDNISPLYKGDRLTDESFTLQELKRRLSEQQYSIVHIASHGQFNPDVRKNFVLSFDQKLTLNDLEALIRPAQYRGKPVELLVLSACQTAAGDDRAALGLAGVAVKAGARSALATLWFVNDQSTSLVVTELYERLKSSPELGKAKALQAAQIKLLKDRRYRHPCYWAPYLIIGNWL